MVEFEAARAICNLKDVTARELTPAISVLQVTCSSTVRFLLFVPHNTIIEVVLELTKADSSICRDSYFEQGETQANISFLLDRLLIRRCSS